MDALWCPFWSILLVFLVLHSSLFSCILYWSYSGEGYTRKLFTDEEHSQVQGRFMRRIFEDTLGFAGCKMVRRVVGVAHVEDLDSISDEKSKGECEARALKVGSMLISNAKSYTDIKAAVAAVAEVH